MPQLQSSGQIRLTDITTEFGGTAPHRISEYYQGGSAGVGDNNTNVPTTGRISLTNFYSAVNSVTQTLDNNSTNVNLSTTFGSDWASSIPKVLVIEAGSTIGGTGGTAAITVPTGMGGTLTIQNAGTIVGTGGAAGAAGGDAIVVSQTSGVTITNTGSIYGGGGGGGTGGNGSYNSDTHYTYYEPVMWRQGGNNIELRVGSWSSAIFNGANATYVSTGIIPYGSGAYHRGSYCCATAYGTSGYNFFFRQAVTTSGGSGGVGAGYGQSAGTGVAGGTNAGNGGDGGAFGASGSTGANGNSSNGSAGGAAGNYINGINNVTLNNTGTVAGNTA